MKKKKAKKKPNYRIPFSGISKDSMDALQNNIKFKPTKKKRIVPKELDIPKPAEKPYVPDGAYVPEPVPVVHEEAKKHWWDVWPA
jgi:hypothetical protein